MSETVSIDFAIIGGGIIGLTAAYELKKRFPNAEIAVFEKERYFGEHSSGRNSGVLHAGLYYPHKSLKHLLCLEGLSLWDEWTRELKINYKKCGKYIFSTGPSEDDKLGKLLENARLNGVQVEWVTKEELSEIQKDVNAFSALVSPNTGIIDVSEALFQLKNALEGRGAHLFLSHSVQTLKQEMSGFSMQVEGFEVCAKTVINCAGHGAILLREQLGLQELENYVVRGHYLTTSQKLSYPCLYYPVPPSDLKGLGVHSTIDLSGKVKFGPNTEDVPSVDYSPPESTLEEMKDSIVTSFKNIDRNKLYWDYAGCRSKIRFKESKTLFSDFWIKSPIKDYIECLGIESPGVTASPAIAKEILKLIEA